jgi:arylsulfatase A-like enzyme
LITRRSLLWTPLAMAAQSRPPAILMVWSNLRSVPDWLAKESVTFPRAYAACPQPAAARRTLETGRFPHAARTGGSTLEELLRSAYRFAIADTSEEVERLAAVAGRASMVVFAGAPDGREDSALDRFLHVPMAIRWPGVIAPRTASEILLSQADVMPTLLGLAGVDAPEDVQGRNLAALLRGTKGEVPDSVYAEGGSGAPTAWRAVIRGFDKLVFNLREEVLGMYNVADDPLESTNLAKEAARDPALKLTRDGLLALARVWMRRVEDGRDSSGLRLR